MMTSNFPLTQYIIDLQKASTMKLKKMDISATARKRGLPVAWVKAYRDMELKSR
jgi:hypothetical protein